MNERMNDERPTERTNECINEWMNNMSAWMNTSFIIAILCFGWGRDVPDMLGGGPRVVVSTAAFHARVRGSVPGLGGLKETKIVSSPSTCES